jgi:hypothetical protein
MDGRGCYRARPPGPLLPSPGPRRPRPTPAAPQLPDGHGHLLPGTGQPVQGSQWRKKTLSFQAPTPQGRTRSAGTDHGRVQASAHTLSWPDFGLTRLSTKERQRKPTRAILAGQLGDAQVTDACVTVYGTEGWGFESLRARPGQRPFRTPAEPVVDLCATAKCSSTSCRIRQRSPCRALGIGAGRGARGTRHWGHGGRLHRAARTALHRPGSLSSMARTPRA